MAYRKFKNRRRRRGSRSIFRSRRRSSRPRSRGRRRKYSKYYYVSRGGIRL